MNHLKVGLIVVAAFIIGIAGTVMTDLWSTESGGKTVSTVRNMPEYEGLPNPADIRGSFTFQDVTRNFNIPLADLAEAFGVTGMTDPGLVRNGDLEELYGYFGEDIEIGNGSVKYFVSLYTGIPYEMESDEYLPLSALDVLLRNLSITNEQYKEMLPLTVDVSVLAIDDDYVMNLLNSENIEENIPLEEIDQIEEVVQVDLIDQANQIDAVKENNLVRTEKGTEDPEKGIVGQSIEITGKTTFREILDMGYTEHQVEQVLERPMPHALKGVKDFCDEEGLSFGKVKEGLAELNKQ